MSHHISKCLSNLVIERTCKSLLIIYALFYEVTTNGQCH